MCVILLFYPVSYKILKNCHSNKFLICSRLCTCFFFRLIVRSGNSSSAPLLFDSDLDDVPERGIVSEGSSLYLELTADSSSIPLLMALRYEGEK